MMLPLGRFLARVASCVARVGQAIAGWSFYAVVERFISDGCCCDPEQF